MKKIHQSPILILLLLTLFSCGNKYVISPENLEDILVDMHIVEAIAIVRSKDFKANDSKVDLYNTIYEKYNITEELFDSSMVYYSENLHAFTEIYENVYSRIEALEKDVKAGQYSLIDDFIGTKTYSRIAGQDLDVFPYVNQEFWNKKREDKFRQADFKIGKTMKVAVDTLYGNTLELRYTQDCKGLNSANCVITMFYDNDKETEKSFELPSDSIQLIKLRWDVEDGLKKLSVGFNVDNQSEDCHFFMDDLRLYDLSSEKHNISIFN